MCKAARHALSGLHLLQMKQLHPSQVVDGQGLSPQAGAGHQVDSSKAQGRAPGASLRTEHGRSWVSPLAAHLFFLLGDSAAGQHTCCWGRGPELSVDQCGAAWLADQRWD